MELNPSVNRDVTNRVRPINGIACAPMAMQMDITYAIEMIKKLDERVKLYEKDAAEDEEEDEDEDQEDKSEDEEEKEKDGNDGDGGDGEVKEEEEGEKVWFDFLLICLLLFSRKNKHHNIIITARKFDISWLTGCPQLCAVLGLRIQTAPCAVLGFSIQTALFDSRSVKHLIWIYMI